MDYVQLGRSGLRVSRLCFGTMNLGKLVDERTSFSLLDAALAAGITSSTPLMCTAGSDRVVELKRS